MKRAKELIKQRVLIYERNLERLDEFNVLLENLNSLQNEKQIINLLCDLMKTKSPLTSPAGKPTLSEISWSDWRKRLGEE